MTPAVFRSRCEAIYGSGWQSALARDLVRDIRTIRRWKTGESPVPKVVVEWLKEQQKRRQTPIESVDELAVQKATENAVGKREKGKTRKDAEHEYGTIQGTAVRPFLKTACDKLAKQMGERILRDYKAALYGRKPPKRKPSSPRKER